MGVGERVAFVRVNDEVFADGHGIGLNIFGNAFGVARLEVKAKGMDAPQ